MDFSSSPSVLSQATTDAGEWLLASDSSVAMSNKDCGLLGLPDEMFLEIVSHLPAFPMALDRRTCQNVDVYGHRQQVLDALCKTCAKLRRLFLQHRWKRVEICYEDATTPPIQLSQQLETATVRQPCLAAFIHVLDLYIPDSSSEEFVSRLAQCMTLLPNLHTVQLDFASQGAPSTSKELLLSKSFAKYIYPQVRTVIVSANGHSFVSQCPAVTTVHLLRPTTFSTVGFLFKIIRSCPALEKLGPLPVLFRKDSADKSSLEHYVDVISERLQTVREVTFAMSKLPSDSNILKLWNSTKWKVIRLSFCESKLLTREDIVQWEMKTMKFLSKLSLANGEQRQLIVGTVLPLPFRARWAATGVSGHPTLVPSTTSTSSSFTSY